MTDANLMDADCIHGAVWYECNQCSPALYYGMSVTLAYPEHEARQWFIEHYPAYPDEYAGGSLFESLLSRWAAGMGWRMADLRVTLGDPVAKDLLFIHRAEGYPEAVKVTIDFAAACREKGLTVKRYMMAATVVDSQIEKLMGVLDV